MSTSKDEFQMIDENGASLSGLFPDTTQGKVYRFLLTHADQAFRQWEIVDTVDVPAGSIGPTLKRLEQRALVEIATDSGPLQTPNTWSLPPAYMAVRQLTRLTADSSTRTSMLG